MDITPKPIQIAPMADLIIEETAWRDISGTTKPEDGADVTAENNKWSEVQDDDGNLPADNATVGATAGTDLKDSGAVVLADTDIKNIDTYELGENINAGQVGCVKNIPKTDTITITDDAFTHSGFPTTNYGSETAIYAGYADGSTQYGFIKVPTSGAPAIYRIMKVELLLYVYSMSLGGGGFDDIYLKNCNASWDESSITHNTKPAVTDDFTTFHSSHVRHFTTDDSGTYVSFDITHMFKAWLAGDKTNNGVEISFSGTSGKYVAFSSSDSTTNKPLVRITQYDTSDNKVYLASNADYNLCRTLVGIALESGTTGQSKKFQKFGRINIGGTNVGSRGYLGTGGNISTTYPGNVTRTVLITKDISPADTATEVSIQNTDILIENIPTTIDYLAGNGTYYAQGDATKVVVEVDSKVIICRYGETMGAVSFSYNSGQPKASITGTTISYVKFYN